MEKPLIVANWKMNPDSPGRAGILAKKIESRISGRKTEVVIAPPFPFLGSVGKALKKAKLGAQDAFWADVGPYTGEVSWHQLKHFGVKYVIVGHSERRINLGETDEMINKKVKAALENDMYPILCVGERERAGNEIPSIVGEQLKFALRGVGKNQLKNLIVAYEPVWAISTQAGARPDTPDNAFRAALFIRKVIASLFDRKTSEKVRVIYGGSVNSGNVVSFLKEGRMQGALVGGASLDLKKFAEIVRLASLL